MLLGVPLLRRLSYISSLTLANHTTINVFCEFLFFFLIMVLGGGGGSKPSVSFLNFEPKDSKFPRPEQFLFWSFHHGDHYRGWRLRHIILISLLNCLASDICSVKEAFCILFVKFLVDGFLGFFDGISSGDEHIDTASV